MYWPAVNIMFCCNNLYTNYILAQNLIAAFIFNSEQKQISFISGGLRVILDSV